MVAVKQLLGHVPLRRSRFPDSVRPVDAHREAVVAIVVVVRIINREVVDLFSEQTAIEPLLDSK